MLYHSITLMSSNTIGGFTCFAVGKPKVLEKVVELKVETM